MLCKITSVFTFCLYSFVAKRQAALLPFCQRPRWKPRNPPLQKWEGPTYNTADQNVLLPHIARDRSPFVAHWGHISESSAFHFIAFHEMNQIPLSAWSQYVTPLHCWVLFDVSEIGIIQSIRRWCRNWKRSCTFRSMRDTNLFLKTHT